MIHEYSDKPSNPGLNPDIDRTGTTQRDRETEKLNMIEKYNKIFHPKSHTLQ